MKENTNENFNSYVGGFLLSISLTLMAYFFVIEKVLSGWLLTLSLAAFAFLQVCVQLFFFLHLGEEKSPYLNLMAFLFMLLMVLILVIGTLWIMYNLDYRMLDSMQM